MKLANIIHRYEKELSTEKLLPQQRKALNAIVRCRTPASGEMMVVYPCCGRIDHYCLSCLGGPAESQLSPVSEF